MVAVFLCFRRSAHALALDGCVDEGVISLWTLCPYTIPSELMGIILLENS